MQFGHVSGIDGKMLGSIRKAEDVGDEPYIIHEIMLVLEYSLDERFKHPNTVIVTVTRTAEKNKGKNVVELPYSLWSIPDDP